MSSIIWMVVRALMIFLIVTIILAFPWPDISPYLVYIQQLVNYIMIANPLVDVSAAFVVVKIVLVIEIILISLRRVLIPLFHFVSSGSFSGGATNSSNEETV